MKNSDRMFSLKDLTKRMVQLLMLMVWAAERGVSFTMKFVAEHPTTDQEIPLGKNPLVRVFPGVVQALKRYGLIYIIVPVSHPADEAVYSLTRKGQEWVRFLEIYRALTQTQRRNISRMFYNNGYYVPMMQPTADKLIGLGMMERWRDKWQLTPFGWRFAAAMEGRMIFSSEVGLDQFLADTGQRPRYALVWAECYPRPLIEKVSEEI